MILEAKDRIKNVKNNLQSCKTLLQCKRDELRKLWVDSTEQKYILDLMEQMYGNFIVSKNFRHLKLRI